MFVPPHSERHDLLFEATDLLVLLLERRHHLVPIPEHLKTELDLVLHLVEHFAERLVGGAE